MKVYMVYKYVTNYIGIFSKEEYAKRYCDEHNKDLPCYWYHEENVDEKLEELYED